MSSGLQVFISFKNLDHDGQPTRDSRLAAEVYQYLVDRGITVFLSNISLEKMGVDEYKLAIDNALDAAQIMIAVGTSADNLNSKWVRYEWDSFYNDILSGVKHGGRFFAYVEGVGAGDLPRTIRHNQLFQHPDDLESLSHFVTRALGATALERAREALEKGNFQEAISGFQEVLAVQADDPEARAGLAEAREALAAIEKSPRPERPPRKIGRKQTGAGGGKESPARIAVAARKAAPHQPRARRRVLWAVLLGIIVLAGLVTGYLVIEHQQQVSRVEGRVKALMALGAELEGKQKFEPALAVYRKVLAIDPGHMAAKATIDRLMKTIVLIKGRKKLANEFHEAGMAAFRKRKYHEAIDHFNQAIRIYKQFPAAYFRRGITYYSLQKWHLAIKDFEACIRLSPKVYYAYVHKAMALSRLGQHLQAIEFCNLAMKLKPRSAFIYGVRGSCYARLKQYERAVHDYSMVISIQPRSQSAYHNRGYMYYQLKKYNRALRDFNTAIKINPNAYNSYRLRAAVHMVLGDRNRASSDLEKFKKLYKSHKQSINNQI